MDARPPPVYRSRSSTGPTRPEHSPTEPRAAGANPPSTRPGHIRAKSYLSPAEPKPRNASNLPAASALEKTTEKLPRIHLPGSSHRHHQYSYSHSHSPSPSHNQNDTALHKRHRPTQSDTQPQPATSRRQQSKEAMSNLPHLVAGLNAEREKRMQAPTPARPVQQHAFGPSGTTTSDYTEGGRYDPQLRAGSDPNRPPLRPKSSFEIALERGDAARVARRVHVKKEDIIKRDAEIAAAEEEIRERVAGITAKGVEITRRLDYGYYNLLETVGNLVAIITSFQSLSKQSEQLITNFDKETRRLDAVTRTRVEAFKGGFEDRDSKVQALAERGKRTSAKAEDLSVRLENARLIVQNWEKREDQVKKVWGRVFGAVWWTSIAMFIFVVFVFLAKEWWFHGDPVKAGLGAHGQGSWNRSLRLGGSERSIAGRNERELLLGREGTPGAKVPEDVRRLLLDIADKNRRRKIMFPTIPRELVMNRYADPNPDPDDRLPMPPRRTPTDSANGDEQAKTYPLPLSFLPPSSFSSSGAGNVDGDRTQAREEDPRLRMMDEL